jgi:hypothetical protein
MQDTDSIKAKTSQIFNDYKWNLYALANRMAEDKIDDDKTMFRAFMQVPLERENLCSCKKIGLECSKGLHYILNQSVYHILKDFDLIDRLRAVAEDELLSKMRSLPTFEMNSDGTLGVKKFVKVSQHGYYEDELMAVLSYLCKDAWKYGWFNC